MYNNEISEKVFTKTQKKVIIILLLILVIVLSLYFYLSKNNSSNKVNETRTIMMYIVGSNLETDSGIVTSDLAAIDPTKINLEKTNVIIYTGGTKKWRNFIKNDENAIYKLTKEGFKKIETYKQENMGDPNVFSSYLKYVYNNFKTDSYDLIIYNHGGAIDGAIYDDFSKDNLSGTDFSNALKNSPFNKNNKLESVIFRTCLNGTVEIANIFSDYANYMIASEEITYGSGYANVLSFINEVKPTDSAIEFGKKFINSYSKQMEDIDPYGSTNNTYSLIDLSKMKEVTKNIGKFASSLDVTNDYATISRVRSNLYQYGEDVEYYDMVDLYELTSELSSLSPSSKQLMNSIKDAVVYNWTNVDEAHGLSIYFPYKGGISINKFLNLYDGLKFNTEYNSFIKKFYKIFNGNNIYSFNAASSKVEYVKNNSNEREFKLQLTNKQLNNFSRAIYIIFKKIDKEYYLPVFSSNNYTLSDDGVISSKLTNNMIKFVDTSDNSSDYIFVSNRVTSGKNNYVTSAVLTDIDDSYSVGSKLEAVEVNFDFNENNQPYVVSYKDITKKGEQPSGVIFKESDFDSISYMSSRYKILDKNGKYTENWVKSESMYGYEIDLDKIKYKMVSLDDTGDYYCVFKVFDIQNNYSYSDLVQIN